MNKNLGSGQTITAITTLTVKTYHLLSLASSVMVTTVVLGVPTVREGIIGPGFRLTEKVWSPSTLVSGDMSTWMHPGAGAPTAKVATGSFALKSVLSTRGVCTLNNVQDKS